MKNFVLYKRLFICQLFLVFIHIFSISGLIKFIGYIIGILGLLSLASLIFQVYIKPSQKKVTDFDLKKSHVSFPRFAQAMEWEDFEKRRINEETPITIPLLVPSLKINARVHRLLNNVIKDFILDWYNELTSSKSFFYELENIIYTATSVIIDHLKKVNYEDFIGKKAIPIVYNHIHEFNLARERISMINSGNPELKISMYYNYGKLHPAVLPTLNSTQKLEYNHLRKIFEKIIPILLDKKVYQSRTIVVLIREILVCKVIQPLIDMLSDPDFYNLEFIDLSERFFGKSYYIQYINEVFGNGGNYKKQTEIPQTYDDFLRMIKECNNLRAACLLRNDIIKEIKLNKTQIANCSRSDIVHGVKVYHIQAYINRIEAALKFCEKRIKELGGPDYQKLGNSIEIPSSLYDVLTTPFGRYYFTKYMEHHNQSYLYNFWMEVQRLRVLPEITPTNRKEVIEKSKSLTPEVNKETIRENVWNIYNTYLFPDDNINDFNQKINMSPDIINSIEIFLYGQPQQTTAVDLDSVGNQHMMDNEKEESSSSFPSNEPNNDYTSIFRAQKYVYDHMESKYYSKFVKSTLYFRFLHDLTSNDEYKNKILQRISDISNINYNNHIDPNTGLQNNGKFRGKFMAMRRKKENSLTKRRHGQNSSFIGRRSSVSSSFSEKNRRIPSRRRSTYSVRRSQLGNTYYNSKGLIPNTNTTLNNNYQMNTSTLSPPSISITPSPNGEQELNKDQMQLLNEAINNSINDISESSLNVTEPDVVYASGTMDNSNNRLSPVSILENYRNNISQTNNDSNNDSSSSNNSHLTRKPSFSSQSMILPGNKTVYSDPPSFVSNEQQSHSSSPVNRPIRGYSRRYYTVKEYLEDNENMDNIEEEYVDNFDDDDDDDNDTNSIFVSTSYSPSIISNSHSARFSVSGRMRRRPSRKYYNSIKIKRKINRSRSRDDYNVSSLKNDILHLNVKKDETKDEKNNSENEWEDEEDYLFYNTKNLYSYSDFPDMSLDLQKPDDDEKSTDTESVAKTITYNILKDNTSTKNGYSSSYAISTEDPTNLSSNHFINNHSIVDFASDSESVYSHFNEHEEYNPTQTIYYNTQEQEEIKTTQTIYYDTKDHETKPLDSSNVHSEVFEENAQNQLPPDIIIRGPSEDDKQPAYVKQYSNNNNNDNNSNITTVNNNVNNSNNNENNDNVNKTKENKLEKAKDEKRKSNNYTISTNNNSTGNEKVESNNTVNEKSSDKKKYKLSIRSLSSSSLKEKFFSSERRKSNAGIVSIPKTEEPLGDSNQNSAIIREYLSDNEYDKSDYISPLDGNSTKNKRLSNMSSFSSISRENSIYVNKRNSTQSNFSISNSLKMEILNDKNKKEEKEGGEEEEEDINGGSMLYKDKYSLNKKTSTESQKSRKGLKKLLNSKIKKRERKKIMEDALKLNYDVGEEEEEDDDDKDDTKSKRHSIISDESNGDVAVTSFHYASPGDLLVSSLIAQVDESMKELEAQKKNIDDLITNAIINKESRRLELLQDAKSQLENHANDLKKQKELYIIQARENAITPKNVSISISDCHIKHDGNKSFALYIIEVNRTNPNGCTSGWIVTRRYSEFVLLHEQLRNKYWSIVHNYELPGKTIFSWIIPKPDVQVRRTAIEKRRIALEKYLRNLLSHEEICKSIELRKFISQQNVDMPPSFKYNKINIGAYEDDYIKRNNAVCLSSENSSSSLAAIPLTNENNSNDHEIKRSSFYKFNNKSMPNVYKSSKDQSNQIKKSSTVLTPYSKLLEKNSNNQTMGNLNFDGFKGGKIIDGIFDIIMELFGIKNKIDWYNWLQHKAFLSFFQQVFSGTLDKKIRQDIQYLVSEPMIEFYLDQLNDSLWPDGEFFINKRTREWEENHIPFERTEEQKKKSKIECYQKLTTQLPELLGSLIGRKKANYGAEFLFELFQNRRLNQHLMYTLFDELFKTLFPEIDNENE
ncbi:hypothetical protein BCR36DRAFT_352980 [Piromyces finnis]|uniref:PX domain-containing protein n=1 Tax=Piromyces finnis TaxID=1754191 RepID=A0A1Y1V939_9FUNG|nr:hypothetical protein BCR36DRAFT_352980 [Piromyces finnis]|eukprot:ORX50056.1 hypothetical protein BCR36DRAFT_352980 [Piromyces finnis]